MVHTSETGLSFIDPKHIDMERAYVGLGQRHAFSDWLAGLTFELNDIIRVATSPVPNSPEYKKEERALSSRVHGAIRELETFLNDNERYGLPQDAEGLKDRIRDLRRLLDPNLNRRREAGATLTRWLDNIEPAFPRGSGPKATHATLRGAAAAAESPSTALATPRSTVPAPVARPRPCATARDYAHSETPMLLGIPKHVTPTRLELRTKGPVDFYEDFFNGTGLRTSVSLDTQLAQTNTLVAQLECTGIGLQQRPLGAPHETKIHHSYVFIFDKLVQSQDGRFITGRCDTGTIKIDVLRGTGWLRPKNQAWRSDAMAGLRSNLRTRIYTKLFGIPFRFSSWPGIPAPATEGAKALPAPDTGKS